MQAVYRLGKPSKYIILDIIGFAGYREEAGYYSCWASRMKKKTSNFITYSKNSRTEKNFPASVRKTPIHVTATVGQMRGFSHSAGPQPRVSQRVLTEAGVSYMG